MLLKLCACCETPFKPLAQVPGQTYCSQPECQRARRQRWNQQKLESDPDYRDNKQRSQRNWMDKNPGYWRQYRANNPNYVQRNRSRQRAKKPSAAPTFVAKIDESNRAKTLKSGIYRITPFQRESAEQISTWIVELSMVCPAEDFNQEVCKGDACKDRT